MYSFSIKLGYGVIEYAIVLLSYLTPNCNSRKLLASFIIIFPKQGGIIVNGRKSNKSPLRKNKINISAGFGLHMPAEVGIL